MTTFVMPIIYNNNNKYCEIQMVRLEFVWSNMKGWIYPDLYQCFRLVVMVWRVFSLHSWSPFVPATAYLSIFTDHDHDHDHSVPILWWLLSAGQDVTKPESAPSWFLSESSEHKWPPHSPNLSLIVHHWDLVKWEICTMDA